MTQPVPFDGIKDCHRSENSALQPRLPSIRTDCITKVPISELLAYGTQSINKSCLIGWGCPILFKCFILVFKSSVIYYILISDLLVGHYVWVWYKISMSSINKLSMCIYMWYNEIHLCLLFLNLSNWLHHILWRICRHSYKLHSLSIL